MKLSGRAAVLALTCASALVLSACGTSKSSSTATGSSTAGGAAATPTDAAFLQQPTSLPVTQKLSKAPPTGVKVAYLNEGVAYAQDYLTGMMAAASVLGWQVKSYTTSAANPASTTSALTSAIDAGAKYVVVSAVDAAIYQSVLPLAKSKGAEILSLNANNPSIPGEVVNVLGSTDAIQGAKQVGEALLADAQSRGVTAHIGEVTVPIFATVLAPERDGLKQALSSCSSCTVSSIPIPAQQFQSGAVAPVIVSYLQSHRDINYLFYDAAGLDVGVAQQLKVAGIEAPRMFGAAAQPAEIKAVQSGTQAGWGAYPSVLHGWILMDAAARLSVGDNPNVWQTSPSYVLEKSNSAGIDPTNFEFPEGYQAMFKALWMR
jgi:ABC-type sugar transport system substrate-binding protein